MMKIFSFVLLLPFPHLKGDPTSTLLNNPPLSYDSYIHQYTDGVIITMVNTYVTCTEGGSKLTRINSIATRGIPFTRITILYRFFTHPQVVIDCVDVACYVIDTGVQVVDCSGNIRDR